MTDAPLAAPGAAIGRSGRVALRRAARATGPVLMVIAGLLALWLLACLPMNAHQAVLEAERDGETVLPATASERRDMSGFALLRLNLEPVTERA
ncbi:MAG: hypothetical protein AAF390_17765, partial [Pseudomonadota bacterium]